jgi:hypothetical protein
VYKDVITILLLPEAIAMRFVPFLVPMLIKILKAVLCLQDVPQDYLQILAKVLVFNTVILHLIGLLILLHEPAFLIVLLLFTLIT